MRIGFDLDGVLVAFIPAFENLLCHIAKKVPRNFPLAGPSVWDFDRERFSHEIISQAWAEIRSSDVFWRRLPMLPNMKLLQGVWNRIHPHDIYFITDRPGATAKYQSEAWLYRHGILNPTVLLSTEKGLLARALELDAYIDDKPENVAQIVQEAPRTMAYLQDRGYNKSCNLGIRVDTINPLLQLLIPGLPDL